MDTAIYWILLLLFIKFNWSIARTMFFFFHRLASIHWAWLKSCPFILLACFELKSISLTDLWPAVEDTSQILRIALAKLNPTQPEPELWHIIGWEEHGTVQLHFHLSKALVLLLFWVCIFHYLQSRLSQYDDSCSAWNWNHFKFGMQSPWTCFLF